MKIAHISWLLLLTAAGTFQTSAAPAGNKAEFIGKTVAPEAALCLWYRQPAKLWEEALPLGNGHIGAMVFGTPGKERMQLNEESLWAGCPVEAWPPDFPKHLAEVRRLLFAGKNAEAQAYGVANMTATPTSGSISGPWRA